MKEKIQQIRQVHAQFIIAVVRACQNRDELAELEPILKAAEDNGWTETVRAARLLLTGRRDEGVLTGLDEEDHAIISGVLEGLQDPSSLPDPNAQADGTFAAPGLAGMVHLAARGDTQALQAIAGLGEQMSVLGGSMARLAATLRRLIDGERDADRLTEGMDTKTRTLFLSILEELAKLDAH